MATITQLEAALKGAHQAGDTDAARRIAAILVKERENMSNYVPTDEGSYGEVPGTTPPPPAQPQSIGDQAVGVGEAALTIGTGATTGTVGMIGGTLKGLAEKILSGEFGTPEAANYVEQQAMKGAEALTYAPRTESGQQAVQTVGEVLEPLAGIAPIAPELQGLGAASRAASQATATAATQVATKGRSVLQNALRPTPSSTTAPPSVGAAGVNPALKRQTMAEELPVPIKLTEGQKTRQFEQQRFERETAKMQEEGAPLRERFAQQNAQLQQNLDAFIDETGGQAPDLRSVGMSVDQALRNRAAKDKARIRTLYKEAEKAGEMEAPVKTDKIIQLLNDSSSAESTAPVLVAAKKELKRLGGAVEDAEGNLVAGESANSLTLGNMEQLRKFINKVSGNDPTNIKFAADLKRVIDESTEGQGGDVYKQARKARAKYARDYEDIQIVDQLLGTKRGSSDRAIAMEDVLQRVVLAPSTSLDSMRTVRRLLQTKAGEEGKQAWRDVQAGTLQYIKDQATKNVARDQAGNPIVSPAQLDRVITQLDKSGKLDYIFGPKGAEQLRLINDVAKDVLTSPPGAVNHSNTATVLAGLMDVALSGTTGIPAPVATSFRLLTKSIKDAKLKARVQQSLGDKQ